MKPSLPPRLRAQVERAADQPYGDRIEAPQAVVSAARDALPGYRAAIAPADARERIAILVTLANMVGKPEVLRTGSAGEQRLFWDKYHELVGHLPAAVLNRACDAFLRAPSQGSKWFPDPGAILALARQDDAWRDDLRCVKGLERLAKAWVTDPREDTDDERAAMLARSEAFRAKLSATIKSQRDAETEEARKALDWYRDPDRWKRPTARQGRAA